MTKDSTIHARVDKQVKAQAVKVLGRVGMTTSEAINLFLKQIVLHKGLPFDVRVPNKETRQAMRDLRAGKGERFTGSTKNAFKEMIRTAK